MQLCPIISELNRDVSKLIYENVCNWDRYVLSIVSRDWRAFCLSRVDPIKGPADVEDIILTSNALRIVKTFIIGLRGRFLNRKVVLELHLQSSMKLACQH